MVSGLGVSVWFFQSTGRDQYTASLKSALASRIAWKINSALTAGIAQITVSTARRWSVRSAS